MSKTGRGDVVELAAHTIELTIPFGFPHFPPSCKPKSDTYHPDFDPAAICLGDFWSHDRELPDLIVHIGRMINGEIYSTANGFNEHACTWYNSHPDFFPLADIDWPSEKNDQDLPGRIVTPAIDTLDDSDLSTDFDFLSLDESNSDQDLSPESTSATGTIDVSLSQDVPPETVPAQFFDELAPYDKSSAKPGKIGSSEKKREPQPSEKQNLLRSSWPTKKKLAYIFGGIIAVCIAGCGYYYLTATNKVGSAEGAFFRCMTLMENGQFEEAEQSCEQALNTIQEVKIFHREKIGKLRTGINRTIQSDRFVQGLNGRVLVDGEYLPIKDSETIKTLRSLQKEANVFFLQENWRQANDRFEKILAMTKNELSVPEDIVADSRTKLGIARFRMIYTTAEHALQNGHWLEAITESHKAESLLSSLPDGDRHQYANNLQKMLAKGTFENHREKGDAFFAESDWQNAIATYRLSLSSIDIAALPEQALEAVRGSMNRAELYRVIDQGNKAFGSGSWDEAIDSYSQAEVFLATPQRLQNMDDNEQNRRKLSRIILQARIVRDHQSAERHLEANDMVAASKVYRQLIKHIKGSPFSGESEFKEILNKIAATIQTLDAQIYIADKAQYLKDEYRTIFIASYPNAIEENLVNPTITFARDSDDKLIFKMQCTESGERPLILILHYAFDKKNGRWELFSEQPSD